MKLENRDKNKRQLIWGLIIGLIVSFWFFEKKSVVAQTRNFPGEKIKWVKAISRWNRVEIFWEKNEYLSETENLILIRKKDVCPKDIFDGEEIYRGNGSFFEDQKVEQGIEYCYGVGIVNLSGGPGEFKVSHLARKLNWKESLLTKLTNWMNLIIFLEVIILGVVFLFEKIKRNKLVKNTRI